MPPFGTVLVRLLDHRRLSAAQLRQVCARAGTMRRAVPEESIDRFHRVGSYWG